MDNRDDLRHSRCEKLTNPSYTNLTISVIILVGLLVSYLPQHYRIISRRTSEGISPYFVLLGVTSATSGFANILVLPASSADVACCKTVSSFECFAGLLGIAQVGAMWFCFSIILLLFLIFFPRGSLLTDSTAVKQPNWRTALGVAFICLLHGLVVLIMSAVFFISRPNYLSAWANILGLMAAALAAIQYFPQIYTTYTLGHVGSLSIPMMCIQTPGGYLFAGSLAARLGVEGWSTWGVYLVSATLQGCLLVMGIYFEVQARRELQSVRESTADETRPNQNVNGSAAVAEDEDRLNIGNGHGNERTPLLAGSRNNPST